MPLFGPPDIKKLKAKRDVKGLLKALRYPKESAVRQAAAQELMELGKPKDAVMACRAMAASGDGRALEPCLLLLKDKDWWVRNEAAKLLGQIRDARAVEPLVVALRDGEESVRNAAAAALAKIGTPVAILVVLRVKNERLNSIVEKTLKKSGAAAIEPFNAALKDEDEYVRHSAIRILGQLGDARAVEPLIAGIGDPTDYVRQSAATALGRIGDLRAVELLIAGIGDTSASVRQSIATALGSIGDPRAVEPLIAVLEDEEVKVRECAGKMLVKIYKSGKLGADDKKAILAHEGAIKNLGRSGHTDYHHREEGCGRSEHMDYVPHDQKGFHVDFPV